MQQNTIVYNVKDYGAKGDGVTDDTSAISSAVTAALAVGGTVYIPAGTYIIATSIAITLSGSSVTIAGAGDKTILKTTGTVQSHAYDIINVTGSGAVSSDRIVIRDIQVLGNATGAVGIALNYCYQGALVNITGKNFTSGSGWGVAVNLNQTIVLV